MKGSRSLLQTGFSSNVAQWHNVPTAYNPADYSSRGLDAIKSSKSQMVQRSFLSQPEDQWLKHISAEMSEGDPEVKFQ